MGLLPIGFASLPLGSLPIGPFFGESFVEPISIPLFGAGLEPSFGFSGPWPAGFMSLLFSCVSGLGSGDASPGLPSGFGSDFSSLALALLLVFGAFLGLATRS